MIVVCSCMNFKYRMLRVLAEHEDSIEERDPSFYTLHETASLVSL